MGGWKIDFPVLDFVIALFIGALVGLEREKKQESRDTGGVGGLRTFILFALAGAISAWLSAQLHTPWIFAAAGLMITSIVITGYYLSMKAHPEAFGMTTEVAAVVVFLLGGAALFGFRELAVALAIATSAVLAYKRPLHGLVEKIGSDDITATLKLLFATFIILPVLPDRTIDPWDAINPYKMWWLVILIAAISLVGYIASRWLGTGRGAPLTGLVGGLVSSTAVSLSFAKKSRDEAEAPGSADALAAGVLLAWLMMFGRILVVAAVLYQPLVGHLIMPVAIMALVTAVMALLNYRRGVREAGETTHAVPLQNPFGLTPAIKFALLFALVMLVVKLAQAHLSARGLYVIAGIAGLADVDPVVLSMAEQAKASTALGVAVVAVIIAVMANTLVKCGFAVVLGSPGLRRRILPATLAILAAAVIALSVA